MLPSNAGESKTVAEAYYSMALIDDPDLLPAPRRCLFATKQIDCKYPFAVLPDRTYEGCRWYYLTFKPFNKGYDPAFNGLDHVRQKLTSKRSVTAYLITREINASKVHYNVLCCSPKDEKFELDGHQTNKYFIYQKLLFNKHDRENVYKYITKETEVRKFEQYIDYVYKL